jgi:hypothetical protein
MNDLGRLGRRSTVAGGLLLALASPLHATEEVAYVEKLSCTSGPYRIKLPPSYQALRRLAKLKREKTHDVEDHGAYQAQYRSLRFVGLELFVVTFSNKPDRYVLSAAILTTPAWRLGGQLRVGAPAHAALRGLPVKKLPADAELELRGKTDSIRVTLAGGRVQEVEYECHTE